MSPEKNALDLPSLEREYKGIISLAESFCKELENQIARLLEDQSITLGFPIQHRVKTWNSLAEKFERVKLKATSVKDYQDLIGLRVILLFERDVSSVCNLIENNFTVIRKYNTQERLKDDQFGYSSVHFVIELRDQWLAVPTLAPMRGLRAEIQVRTVAQHIWAEASQALQYKQKESVPASVTRAIHRVSALLETVDLEFERVLEQRDSYRADVDISGTDDSLNVDLLEKTLDSLLPIENKSGDEDYAALLEDLSHFKITTQRDLKELISKHLDSVLMVEKSYVASHLEALSSGQDLVGTSKERTMAGVFYTHAGLTREALSTEFGDLWSQYQEEHLDLQDDWSDTEDEYLEAD